MKYLIICEDRGVFLGTYEKYGFFSNLEDFGCYKAPVFDKKEEAEIYAKKFLDTDKEYEYIFPEFETEEKYVSCVDIIKKGYGDYTGEMIGNLPNYEETMH